MITYFLPKDQVSKRVWTLEVWSENGCGKFRFFVRNRAMISRTGRHTPTKNSQEFPPRRDIATILNEFNQSLEGKKNLICRRLSKKNFPSGNFVQQRQRNPIEKRASSFTCSPCRVKTHCLNFLTLLKLPNETKRTDKSFLFKAFLDHYLINKAQCYKESLEQFI